MTAQLHCYTSSFLYNAMLLNFLLSLYRVTIYYPRNGELSFFEPRCRLMKKSVRYSVSCASRKHACLATKMTSTSLNRDSQV